MSKINSDARTKAMSAGLSRRCWYESTAVFLSLKKINIRTDTTFFLGLEAQKRNYDIYYYEPKDLSFVDGKVIAGCSKVKFQDNFKKPIKILKKIIINLIKAKLILIRNEPPFNQQYINTTFILEHICRKTKIINDPKALREVPEKLYSLRLAKFMPSTLISEDLREIKKFFDKNKKVVIKPIESYTKGTFFGIVCNKYVHM